MSLYTWQVFMVVAEEKSFVKAAERLNVSQSAVSHLIRKLEQEYGYPLFIRSRNNIELTQNGMAIMPYVRNVLDSTKALEQQVNNIGNATGGNIRIASFYSASVLWLPDIISEFKVKYPNVNISVIQTGDLHIRELVNDGKVDLAFLSIDSNVKGSIMPLYKTEIICLSDKKFVPKNGKSVTREDLDGQNIIMQMEGYDTEFVLWLKENNVNYNCDFRLEVDAACHHYVSKGFGLCLTSRMTYDCAKSDVAIWPLEPAAGRTVALVTVAPEYHSPVLTMFRKEIIKYMNEMNLLNI